MPTNHKHKWERVINASGTGWLVSCRVWHCCRTRPTAGARRSWLATWIRAAASAASSTTSPTASRCAAPAGCIALMAWLLRSSRGHTTHPMYRTGMYIIQYSIRVDTSNYLYHCAFIISLDVICLLHFNIRTWILYKTHITGILLGGLNHIK